VYFWGLPNKVKAFLKEIRFQNNPYLFAVGTCGNVIGASLIQINDLLKLQRRTLDSGFRLQMPENYIVYYNADSKEKQQKLFLREKSKVADISKIVIDKKVQPIEKSKYVVDMLFGKAMNSVSVRNFSTKDAGFILNDACIGCGQCEKVCSMGNITMENGKPKWNHHCEFCMGCLQNCPKEAINYKNNTQKRDRYQNPNVSLY
jgi:ferredoxin